MRRVAGAGRHGNVVVARARTSSCLVSVKISSVWSLAAWICATTAAVGSDVLVIVIVLGAAWESPDIHLALSRALYASGNSSLGWMARLRTIELLESGRRLYRTDGLTTEALVSALQQESTRFTAEPEAIAQALRQDQESAQAWRAEREAFVLAQLDAGRHPDTDPTFWDGAPE